MNLKLLSVLCLLCLCVPVTKAQQGVRLDEFKATMLPQVGHQIAIVGKLQSGKLGWFVANNGWPVYIYATRTADIRKQNLLSPFAEKTVEVTGIVHHFIPPPVSSSAQIEARPPEHFYFDLNEAVVIPREPLASPAIQARKFYQTYLRLKIRGLPNRRQLRLIAPLITPELNELFVSAIKEQTDFITQHPDEKPPWTDGDLFTSLFEGAQSFRLDSPTINGDQGEVKVHLVYRDRRSTTRWDDVLVLTNAGSRWLVSDILFKGNWAFKTGESLRGVLTAR